MRGVMIGWLCFGAWCAPACADGGALLFSAKERGYQIAVFTAPSPFRAGPVDMSVLVQDSSTGQPMPNARVNIRMTKLPRLALEYTATLEAATNKLFRAAQFVLPEPGRWEVEVQVEGSQGRAVLRGEVEAAEPLPRWREMWPWIGWPALAIAIFGIHQVLARKTARNPGPVPSGRRRSAPRDEEYVPEKRPTTP
jgi:hypothetical protein